MHVVDSRRVTGSNFYAAEPGAVIVLAFDDRGTEDPHAVVAAWRRAITRVLPWPGELRVRHHAGGVALFVPGPLDVLMPLTELNEWAVACAEAELGGQPEPPLDPAVMTSIADAHVPGLAELIVAARARGLPLCIDDEAITLGTGAGQLRFGPHGPLPAPASIAWDALARIPIGIVTGTNGKTTTTRLVARMARAAGKVPGITSSDGVAVDEQLVHRGDFSGPEGTRLVLRDPAVEIAILETARGGLLRRGLTVEQCDAAVITNVSADHLGDHGVDDVATMASVKAMVGRGARTVILNADDPALLALAPSFTGEVIWFSRHPRPGIAWSVRDGMLVHDDRPLIALAQVPITFGGQAAYNLENALAAAALGHALGLPDDAIVAGLASFTSSSEDNPGRGNLLDVGGVMLLLDFGHNPAAIRGVVGLARAMLAERGHGALRITIGMPGDRLDAALHAIAGEIAAGQPAQVIVRELPEVLLRGRAPGAVTTVLAAGLRAHGVQQIAFAASELDAVQRALADAQPGDLILVLTHLDPAVRARVDRLTPPPRMHGQSGLHRLHPRAAQGSIAALRASTPRAERPRAMVASPTTSPALAAARASAAHRLAASPRRSISGSSARCSTSRTGDGTSAVTASGPSIAIATSVASTTSAPTGCSPATSSDAISAVAQRSAAPLTATPRSCSDAT